jgi:plasmid maintenance system antidote protein VapI
MESSNMDIVTAIKCPGEALKTILYLRGIQQKDLVVRMRVWPSEISSIVLGKYYIGNYFGMRLDAAMGSEPGFWRKLQHRCDVGPVTMKIGVSFDD